jgi:hypothetical protein
VEIEMKLMPSLIVFTVSMLVVPLAADQRPSFVFGGKQFYIGMSMSEAVRLLNDCCRLLPPIEANIEKNPLTATQGHFILKKGTEAAMLGGVFFADQKVTRLTKPMADDVDSYNEDLVAFARALKRVLHNDAGDVERTAKISVQHEKVSNAESDIISITFSDGRGIELHIGTLDKPFQSMNRRDFVTADETLGFGQ